MPGRTRLHLGSYRRAGRLIPRRDRGLKAGAVILKSGGIMDWHSTERREELIVVVEGEVVLELQPVTGRPRLIRMAAGRCAFLPSRVLHRVVNRSKRIARYLYITADSR